MYIFEQTQNYNHVQNTDQIRDTQVSEIREVVFSSLLLEKSFLPARQSPLSAKTEMVDLR